MSFYKELVWAQNILQALDIHVDNLCDFFTGTLFIKLLAILSGKNFPGKFAEDPKTRIQQLDNVDKALRFAKSVGVAVSEFAGNDIVDRNEKIIASFLYVIQKKFPSPPPAKMQSLSSSNQVVSSLSSPVVHTSPSTTSPVPPRPNTTTVRSAQPTIAVATSKTPPILKRAPEQRNSNSQRQLPSIPQNRNRRSVSESQISFRLPQDLAMLDNPAASPAMPAPSFKKQASSHKTTGTPPAQKSKVVPPASYDAQLSPVPSQKKLSPSPAAQKTPATAPPAEHIHSAPPSAQNKASPLVKNQPLMETPTNNQITSKKSPSAPLPSQHSGNSTLGQTRFGTEPAKGNQPRAVAPTSASPKKIPPAVKNNTESRKTPAAASDPYGTNTSSAGGSNNKTQSVTDFAQDYHELLEVDRADIGAEPVDTSSRPDEPAVTAATEPDDNVYDDVWAIEQDEEYQNLLDLENQLSQLGQAAKDDNMAVEADIPHSHSETYEPGEPQESYESQQPEELEQEFNEEMSAEQWNEPDTEEPAGQWNELDSEESAGQWNEPDTEESAGQWNELDSEEPTGPVDEPPVNGPGESLPSKKNGSFNYKKSGIPKRMNPLFGSQRGSYYQADSGYARDQLFQHKLSKAQAYVRGWLQRKKFKKMLKDCRHRDKVVQEILASEETYVAGLQLVNTVYLQQLSWNAKISPNPVLTMDQINAIFSTISEIYSFNKALLEEFKHRFATWTPRQKLGDAIINLAPYLKLYQTYCLNYDNAIATLQKSKLDPQFAKFLESCMNHPSSTAVMSLEALLITVVQRVPRYILLIQDLIKHTWQDHPDFHDLNRALKLIQDIAEKLNKSIGTAEKQAKVVAIQQSLVGYEEELVTPSRLFIKEGSISLCKLETTFSKDKEGCLYFLFNDSLLVTGKKANDRYLFKQFLDFKESMKVKPLADNQVVQNAFQVVTTDKSLMFACETLEEKKFILSTINEVRDKSANRSATALTQITMLPQQTAAEDITVTIQKTETLKEAGKKFTVYHIKIRYEKTKKNTIISKRYSDFDALQKLLKKSYPSEELPDLPKKHLLGSLAKETVESRRVMLELYLQSLVHKDVIRNSGEFHYFLKGYTGKLERSMNNNRPKSESKSKTAK